MRRTRSEPDLVPLLSVGKHRSPRQGACFMEFASYLAGERWSDHPACTHPTLAHLARMVNDCTTDAGRARLTPMIPSVIGLTSDDPVLDPLLALRAAHTALPIAPEERQRTIAVAVHVSASALRQLHDDRGDALAAYADEILLSAPAADAWARAFLARMPRVRRPLERAVQARHLIACAVDGVARACIDDADARLIALLQQGIADVERALHQASDTGPGDVSAALETAEPRERIAALHG